MSKFLRKVSSKWQRYRYRFVPWVALNLKERTVRSVKDVGQDKIIPDEEVEETYKKLFSALDADLRNQDGGGKKLQVLETESRSADRSKVNGVAKSYQDDTSTRFNHHDNILQECQSSTVQSPFHRTFNMFRCFSHNQNQKNWTSRLRWRESQDLDRFSDTYLDKNCKQKLVPQLKQNWTSGAREFFRFGYKDGDFGRLVNRASFGLHELSRIMIKIINIHPRICSMNFSCIHQQTGCSHQVPLSVHQLPPHAPHHYHYHHDHHHHHHHHQLCHDQGPNHRALLKQKSSLPSTQLGHHQSTSAHLGQNKMDTLDQEMDENLNPGATVMHQTLGYAVGRCLSQIDGGGVGVYVTKGVVPKGAVVAMYPGTIYYPAEPILFQSIANPFVFRCLDGIHIDGNEKRLSKMIYRSCARRDRLGPYMFSDLSWLTSCPLNPMAVGQYVNNQHKGSPANVCYQEFDVPLDFPIKLRKYIPNAFFSTLPDIGNAGRSMRTVALVSLREIQCGEELLSSYFTLIY